MTLEMKELRGQRVIFKKGIFTVLQGRGEVRHVYHFVVPLSQLHEVRSKGGSHVDKEVAYWRIERHAVLAWGLGIKSRRQGIDRQRSIGDGGGLSLFSPGGR